MQYITRDVLNIVIEYSTMIVTGGISYGLVTRDE
jgi:hypothetical protein